MGGREEGGGEAGGGGWGGGGVGWEAINALQGHEMHPGGLTASVKSRL